MTFGVKAMRRSWVPDLVDIEGSFVVSGGAILNPSAYGSTSIRPHWASGFVLAYLATGVYGVTLDETSFASIIDSSAWVSPAAAISGSAVPTANPVQLMITGDFLSYSAGNYAADSTNSKLVISSTTGGALADPSANYRVSFAITCSENPNSR